MWILVSCPTEAGTGKVATKREARSTLLRTHSRVHRGKEPNTIVIAHGQTLHRDEALRQGIIDLQAAAVIASQDGTNKPAPVTREDHKHPEDAAVVAVAAAADTPEGALLASIQVLISGPGGPTAELAFLDAVRTLRGAGAEAAAAAAAVVALGFAPAATPIPGKPRHGSKVATD